MPAGTSFSVTLMRPVSNTVMSSPRSTARSPTPKIPTSIGSLTASDNFTLCLNARIFLKMKPGLASNRVAGRDCHRGDFGGAALPAPGLSQREKQGNRLFCPICGKSASPSAPMPRTSSGNIPFGPKGSAFTSPFDLYPSTGAPTSLISLGSGAPVALGLLLQSYVASQPKVLFCPSSDQS